MSIHLSVSLYMESAQTQRRLSMRFGSHCIDGRQKAISSFPPFLEFIFHRFFFSASMFKCSWELRAARREDKSVSSGSYTSAVLRRHVLYRVIATPVVQEGKVLLERGRPAAWSVTDLVLTAFLPEARPHHVLHGDVVVVPVGCALAAAVTQQHRLVAVVAESQFANGQLQLPQGAGLRPAGSFSPSGLLVSQATALPPLPVKQGADHLLELALRETLEHCGNWQKGDKTTLMHCFDDCLIFV